MSGCGPPEIEPHLLIPQHKVHIEPSEVRVMMHHHYEMRTQAPPLISLGSHLIHRDIIKQVLPTQGSYHPKLNHYRPLDFLE